MIISKLDAEFIDMCDKIAAEKSPLKEKPIALRDVTFSWFFYFAVASGTISIHVIITYECRRRNNE